MVVCADFLQHSQLLNDIVWRHFVLNFGKIGQQI